jgi:hypothetical protein
MQENYQRAQIIAQMKSFSEHYYRCQYCITCRVAAADYSFTKFVYVEVADFTDEQIQMFVQKWFHDNPEIQRDFLKEFTKDDHRGLRELARTPILLSLLCLSFEHSPSRRFPPKRTNLYEEGITILLEHWDKERKVERDQTYQTLSVDAKRSLLARIASDTFERNEYFFKQQDLEAFITDFLSLNQEEAFYVLKAIEAQHGLLVERARQIYSFSHLSFQEFFAARYIIRHCSKFTIQKLLTAANITDSRWQEVILNVASLMDNADYFFYVFLNTVNKILAHKTTLIRLINWSCEKSSIQGSNVYKPAALRSYYLYLSLSHTKSRALARDIAYNLDFDRPFSIEMRYSRVFDQALAKDLNIDIARTLAQVSILDYVLSVDHVASRTARQTLLLKIDTILYFMLSVSISMSALSQDKRIALEALLKRERLSVPMLFVCAVEECQPLSKLYQDLNFLQCPLLEHSTEVWHEFAISLQLIIKAHRDIDTQAWYLREEQEALLQGYLEAVKLLLDCLKVATVTNRKAIEKLLLLPPKHLWDR